VAAVDYEALHEDAEFNLEGLAEYEADSEKATDELVWEVWDQLIEPRSPDIEGMPHIYVHPIAEADVELAGLSGRFRLNSYRARLDFLDGTSPLTVLHEFAHLLTIGEEQHGAAWRSMFCDLIEERYGLTMETGP
jgi:hypothetical protein